MPSQFVSDKSNKASFIRLLGFIGLYSPLSALLDKIKIDGPKGKPLPKTGPKGTPVTAPPPAGATDTSAKAYGDTTNKAKDAIKPTVDILTAQEVDYLSGIGFTDPGDDAKKRADIVNSVHAAWDKAASKYMKLDGAGGDAARADMQKRLEEFDTAIATAGKTPVTPDQ